MMGEKQPDMNNAQAVAALVGRHTEHKSNNQFSGDNAALSAVLQRHPSLITRMTKAGAIPVRYNPVLMAWAGERGVADEMARHLGKTCPCCNQPLPKIAVDMG